MSLLSDLKRGYDIAQAVQDLLSAGAEAFDSAVDMCGNEGQVAIIESMGDGAFQEAAMSAFGGDDAEGALLGACPYPDAVGEILSEAAGIIDDVASEVREALGVDEGDDD